MLARPLITSIHACGAGAFLSLVALSVGAFSQEPQRPPTEAPWELAPDGARGFGTSPEPEDVTDLIRSKAAADLEFVGGLLESATQVQILVALAHRRYERMGYLELVPPGEPGSRPSIADPALGHEFEVLAERFGVLLQAPDSLYTRTQALAFARMVADDRFRVRAHILKGVELDLVLLPGTLRIFTAHAHGLAGLEKGPALNTLASQADLAAARLRALRLDLEALYQPVVSATHGDSAEVVELAAALTVGDTGRAEALVGVLDARARKSARMLEQGLFTPRLDLQHVAALAERRAAWEKGARSNREMELLVPFRSTGGIGGEIGGVRATDRYQLAVNSGREGLAAAPAHPELNFSLGLCLDFIAGRGISMRYFDRFLALRGILHWEERCFSGRPLDAREAYAAWVLTGWRPPEVEDR
ncbi:MAG: hypothetical protein CMJ98_07405 [Planctomycetes bacterium]|jgi:hypothetical protein|nr:hypothetical protein [Planctomycetota bacterium]HJM57848.1 hypothetical protein [Planctomycetota bacterium]